MEPCPGREGKEGEACVCVGLCAHMRLWVHAHLGLCVLLCLWVCLSMYACVLMRVFVSFCTGAGGGGVKG